LAKLENLKNLMEKQGGEIEKFNGKIWWQNLKNVMEKYGGKIEKKEKI